MGAIRDGSILLLCVNALLAAHPNNPQSPPAPSNWSKIHEGTINVLVQGDPSRAASLLHAFAELRSALSQASAFHPDLSASLKVIAFHSDAEFNQYRLNASSTAYYQQTSRADYIVLPDLASGHREVSLHEFTHFVIAHSNVKLPLWLNEGVADFYSTFQVSEDSVTFGRQVAGRLHILHSRKWLPLNRLFEVAITSADYTNPEYSAVFYSEAWALAHMLIAGPGYSDRFPNFLRTLAEGHSATESLLLVYNKSLPQIQEDLQSYVAHGALPLVRARFLPLPVLVQSASLSVPSTEIDIALADLSLTNPNTQAGLQSRLAAASNQPDGSPEAEEALGYLAFRQGKMDDARTHFRHAVDRHSSDPQVLFYLAHLDRDAGVPSDQVTPLLERALALKPDLSDARLDLALVAASDGKYDDALAALQKLTNPRPEYAYTAAYTEAYCYAYSDRLEKARSAAHHAQSLAANDRDHAEIAQLLEYIDQQAKLY